MANKGQKDYTDADRLEAIQLLDEKFGGNLSQAHKYITLDNGKKVPKQTLAEWNKPEKRKLIEESVKIISDRLEVVREDGSSIDLKEANRVKLAKHDNTLIDTITETEQLLYDKLKSKLEDGSLSEAGMFKFGDMIKERIAVIYKEDTNATPGDTTNIQNNFWNATKREMKELGIV